MSWIRRATNRLMSFILSKLAGVLLPDSQCGFRLIHIPSIQDLELSTDCFEIESEMVLKAATAGLVIGFVPIPVIPCSRRSRIRPLIDSWRWLRWLGTCRTASQSHAVSAPLAMERVE